MRLFPLRIELANVVAVQRAHDADPREHHRAAEVGDQDQRLDGGLPFRQSRFLLWQIGYVGRRVLQRQQLPAIRQRDRIIEAGAPGHYR
jgi:hypothetical protein